MPYVYCYNVYFHLYKRLFPEFHDISRLAFQYFAYFFER